jgi:hypothetical protein
MPKNPDGGFTIDDSMLHLRPEKEVEEEQEEQKKSPDTEEPPAPGN